MLRSWNGLRIFNWCLSINNIKNRESNNNCNNKMIHETQKCHNTSNHVHIQINTTNSKSIKITNFKTFGATKFSTKSQTKQFSIQPTKYSTFKTTLFSAEFKTQSANNCSRTKPN